MKSQLISLMSGIIFAIGLTVSGMINPDKVRGFLNLFSNWDYSLAFVMMGAIGFNIIVYEKIMSKKPICADQHFLPTKTEVDWKLVVGAMLFGAGWGILGICPGPGLVNLVTLEPNILMFVGSMYAGMMGYKLVEKKLF